MAFPRVNLGKVGIWYAGVDALPTPEARRAAQLVEELHDAWTTHKVLFFPGIGLTPAQQVRLASVFGPRLAATTEVGGDYRGAPTLADEGFPQLLLLDTGLGHRPSTTNLWHTDVTFADKPVG